MQWTSIATPKLIPVAICLESQEETGRFGLNRFHYTGPEIFIRSQA
jgi:hypothetical protein